MAGREAATGAKPWPVNQWYVAGWDNEVDRKPIARTICGEPIMLYRKFDGGVVAMRDACPHRLLPLSLGIREGDNIRCKYHGLMLGPDGKCLAMPLSSDAPKASIFAKTYPVAERHRFVWVWIGDAAQADGALIPDFWPCSTPGWVFDGGAMHVACDYRLLIDNLMDLTHETYVHQGSIGQPELMESPIETSVDGDKVVVSRWMPDIDAPPFWRNALKKDGPVHRWQVCHFLAPSNVIIDVGVAPANSGATLENHTQGVRGFVIDAMTPESETSCHYFWGMARNFDQDDAGFTGRFKKQQGMVFDEDQVILEAQQKALALNPDMKMRNFNIDAGGMQARLVIERMLRAQAAQS